MGRYDFEKKRDQELKLRKISCRITDDDLRALMERCGRNGLKVQDLFEVFIGDLIGGSFYSGSDEGDLADQWFDRHGFSWMDESLLKHILERGSADEVDRFVWTWDARKVEEDSEEIRWMDEDISDILEGWKGDPTEDEIQKLREWLKEYEELRGEES